MIKTPGPRTSIFKIIKEYRSNPVEYMGSLVDQFGDLVHLKIFGRDLYILTNPEDIDLVLAKNAKNYIKGRTTQKLRIIIGSGLITNEGDSWKEQQRIIRPSFTTKKNRLLVPAFLKHTELAKNRWGNELEVDIHKELQSLTLNMIAESLFHHNDQNDLNWFSEIDFLMNFVVERTRTALPTPLWIPTSKNRRFFAIRNKIDEIIYRIIDQRAEDLKNKVKCPEDLLSFLLNDENRNKMDRQQLRDEVMTLYMAGHETTANALSWVMIELANHPMYQTKLKEIATKIFAEPQERWAELIEADEFSGWLLQESMRLHPPVWVFMRECINGENLRGHQIAPGSMLVIGVYFLQRSAKHWDRPQEFVPERFSEKSERGSGPTYLPFGYGPRVCLGQQLAMLEMKTILLRICQDYQFEFVKKEEQKVEAGITLRPLNNTQLRLRRLATSS